MLNYLNIIGDCMIDDILIFIKLIEYGSLRKVSSKLGIQHSTVSRRISQLENKIGLPLIKPVGKSFIITTEGKYLYEKFNFLDRYTSRVLDSINIKTKKTSQDEITLCLASVLSYEMLCPYIGQFINQFPNLKLNLSFHFGKITNLVPSQEEEELNTFVKKIIKSSDIMFATYDDMNLKTHDHRFIRRESIKLYCRPEYANLYGIPEQIQDLEKHLFIGGLDHFTGDKFDYIKFINNKTNEEVIINNDSSKIRTNSALHMKKIGLSSNYIFGCWESLCKNEISQGLLIPILTDWSAHSIEFFLISRKKLRPIEQEFINFIYKCIS